MKEPKTWTTSGWLLAPLLGVVLTAGWLSGLGAGALPPPPPMGRLLAGAAPGPDGGRPAAAAPDDLPDGPDDPADAPDAPEQVGEAGAPADARGSASTGQEQAAPTAPRGGRPARDPAAANASPPEPSGGLRAGTADLPPWEAAEVPPTPPHRLTPLGLRPFPDTVVQVDPWLERATLAERDLGGALPLVRQRTLGFDAPGLFGRGWRSDVESRLLRHGELVVAVREDGARIFVPVTDGLWVSDLGEVEWLTRVDDGYTLGEPHRVLHFDGAGRLTRAVPGFAVEREASRLGLRGDDGARLELELDRAGRVVRATCGEQVVGYRYDAQGELVAREGSSPRRYEVREGWLEAVVSVGSERAVRLELTADDALRLAALTHPEGRVAFAYAPEALTMDAQPGGRWVFHALEDGWRIESPGQRARVWLDARGRAVATQVGAGPIQRRHDDALGRALPAATLPSGAALEPELDDRGRLVGLRGPAGASESYRYDDQGRPSGYRAWDGSEHTLEHTGDALSARHDPAGTTRYERDERGRLTAVVTPAGRRWTFRRDAAGRVTEADGPAGRQVLAYDRLGRVSQRSDASGRAWFYLRDRGGLLEEIVTQDGGRLGLTHDGAGRPTLLTLGEERLELSYDAQGRLAATRTQAHALSYAREGLVERLDTPWGALTRERDADGRLQALETEAGTFRVERDRHGQVTALAFPNGVTTRIERDPLGQQVARVAATADAPVLRWEATRDAQHRLTAVAVDDQRLALTRDPSGRLTAVRGPALTRRYAYDADGHRVALDDTPWKLDGQGRLRRIGADPVRHDRAGRLLAWGPEQAPVRYDYDGCGRLRQVQRAGHTIRYGYDPLGRVATRSLDGETARYVYESDQLLAQVGPGERLRLFVHGDGVDQPWAYWEDGAWTYLHADDQGTVLAYSDAAGRVIARAAYGPFGELLRDPGGDLPLFWAGRPLDREADLVDLRARPYAPALGRFLVPDPAGLAGGINAYAYADNQPLCARDPQGLLGLQTAFEALFDGSPVVVAAPFGLGRVLAVGAESAGSWIADVVADELDRRSAEERRLWLELIRTGVLNPADRTPPYPAAWRNLAQPVFDTGAQLGVDYFAGRRAILADVLRHGPAALTRDGPAGAAVRTPVAIGEAIWQDQREHAGHVVQRLAEAGFPVEGPGAALTVATAAAFLIAEHSGGAAAYEAITGRDLRAWVDTRAVRPLTTSERIRSGLIAGLDLLTLGTASRTRLALQALRRGSHSAGRAVTRLGSALRGAAAPRAPPQARGLVQALGGEARGASRVASSSPPGGATHGASDAAHGASDAARPHRSAAHGASDAARPPRSSTRAASDAPAPRAARPPEPTQRRLLETPRGQQLPGEDGVELARNLSERELADLSRRHGVEFAVVYERGSGPAGKGGKHFLYSGDADGVSVGPLIDGRFIKAHTHPNGTPYPSDSDLRALRRAAQNGSPQRTSLIVPAKADRANYGQPARFGDLPRGPVTREQLGAPLRHPEGSPLHQPPLVPAPERLPAALGGFRRGISADEIRALNADLGGVGELRDVSTALANAARQEGFWNKTATLVRDIAGAHAFRDGNKRTALAVVNELVRRNGVVTGVSQARLREAIADVAAGKLRDVRAIARALRGS